MSKKIRIEELFMLRKFFTNKYFPTDAQKQVEEFFKKKNYRSKAKDFKPGSDNHVKELAKDKIIADIPEHPVTFEEFNNDEQYEIQFSVGYNDSNISLQRGYITIQDSSYNYDTEEYEEFESKWYFFKASRRRSFSSQELIFDYMQLFTMDKIVDSLMNKQKEDDYFKWRDWFSSKEEYRPYLLVLHKITVPELQMNDVKVYSDRIEVDGVVYTHKYLSTVSKAEKDKDYEFYDSSDKRIEFRSDYNHKHFLDFWEYHTENE